MIPNMINEISGKTKEISERTDAMTAGTCDMIWAAEDTVDASRGLDTTKPAETSTPAGFRLHKARGADEKTHHRRYIYGSRNTRPSSSSITSAMLQLNLFSMAEGLSTLILPIKPSFKAITPCHQAFQTTFSTH